MNGKFYRLIPLLLIAFFSVGLVQAQGDYARRDRDRSGNRYDQRNRNDRYDQRNRDDRYDQRNRNNRYDRNRGYNDRYYGHNEIRRRPHAPRYARPIRPSSFHIWIDGDWAWNNGRYMYRNGYWAVPQNGYVWVPGHWQRARHGWYWVNGFWQTNRNRW